MKLKRIGVLSLGYVVAIAYALLGFFQGVLISLQISNQSLLQQLTATADPTVLAALGKIGWWMVLIVPVSGLVAGFVIGILAAVIYNYIIAKITGGLKLDFEK